MPSASNLFLCCYFAVLLALCIYGCHRYFLVWLYYRHRANAPRLTACFTELPRVTVQLPMFNEPRVARRIIEAAAALDYPSDRLEIQVLDDSTDETTEISRQTVKRLRDRGINIVRFHRENRTGFKAGALAEAVPVASGEFICIFDADFTPPPNILRSLIHYFTSPDVGVVQARWDHSNRRDSMLTKAQAVLLDGHFIIEHTARNRSGRFMSFNGTAGIWRKSCIEDAGGWQHDTLTEDLDLSYRAQMKGWRFVYLPEVTAPAELPPQMPDFKTQQRRWTRGGVQTLRKLLPAVLRSRLPLRIKIEAFFHLTACTVHLYVLALSIMVVPAILMRQSLFAGRPVTQMFFDLTLFLLACCSTATFFAVSQRELFQTWKGSVRYIPLLMCLGIGISINNAFAALAGFFGGTGEFVRTPKYAATLPRHSGSSQPADKTKAKRVLDGQTGLELLAGTFFLICILYCVTDRDLAGGIPFLALFMVGYFYVGICSLISRRESPHAARSQSIAPTVAAQLPG